MQSLNSPLYFLYLLVSYQERTHTCSKGKESESDTSSLCVYMGDKEDSKALLGCGQLALSPIKAGDERLHTDRRSINTRFR